MHGKQPEFLAPAMSVNSANIHSFGSAVALSRWQGHDPGVSADHDLRSMGTFISA